MQTIDKRQIFQVLTGMSATIAFFWFIDYPLTSSALIANFIILILSPTQESATFNIKGQISAQIVGISLGVMLALTIHNVYIGVAMILVLVLTLPIWLKFWIPSLPLAIAAFIIFQAETLADATVERILIKAMSLSIAFVVSWLFAQRYTKKKATKLVYHQFLQLSQLLHEFMWRTPREIMTLSFPKLEPLPAVAIQLLSEDESDFVQLNQHLLELQSEMRTSKESLPLPVQQELQYALRMHHDYFQVLVAKQERGTLFCYTIPEHFIVSTWSTSRLLALTVNYFQQLQQLAHKHAAHMQISKQPNALEVKVALDHHKQE
ncbi:MAG: hypothetical protein ACRCWD_06815 [Culicoidibacterales bacterium]